MTVTEFIAKLSFYANAAIGNGNHEVLVAYDGDVAFPVLRGDTNTAAGLSGMRTFLVLLPDLKGDRLKLKPMAGNA